MELEREITGGLSGHWPPTAGIIKDSADHALGLQKAARESAEPLSEERR